MSCSGQLTVGCMLSNTAVQINNDIQQDGCKHAKLNMYL